MTGHTKMISQRNRQRAPVHGRRPILTRRKDNIRPVETESDNDSEDEEDEEDEEEKKEWQAEFDMSEIRKAKLPKELIIMKNPDKEFHEFWTAGRNIVNIIHPFRCCLFGPPNVGKSTAVLNILMRADPPFEEVFLTIMRLRQ